MGVEEIKKSIFMKLVKGREKKMDERKKRA
jgi:DNA replicative helicase MCM subunit Mcm2 (Cdc46/Mcm family)